MNFFKMFLDCGSLYTSVSLYTMYTLGYIKFGFIMIFVYVHATITLVMQCTYPIFSFIIKYAYYNITYLSLYTYDTITFYLVYMHLSFMIFLRNVLRSIYNNIPSFNDLANILQIETCSPTIYIIGPTILTLLILLAILGTAILGLNLARHSLAPIRINRGSRRDNSEMILVFAERDNQPIRHGREITSNIRSRRLIYDLNDTTGLFLEMVDIQKTATLYANVGVEWLFVSGILHKCLVYDDFTRAARQPILVNTWMYMYYKKRFGVITPRVANSTFDYYPTTRMPPVPSIRSPSTSGITIYPDGRTHHLLRNRSDYEHLREIDRYLGR